MIFCGRLESTFAGGATVIGAALAAAFAVDDAVFDVLAAAVSC